MSDDVVEGCIFPLVSGILLLAAAVAAVIGLVTVGAVFGAGIGLSNYFQALRASVQPERPVS